MDWSEFVLPVLVIVSAFWSTGAGRGYMPFGWPILRGASPPRLHAPNRRVSRSFQRE